MRLLRLAATIIAASLALSPATCANGKPARDGSVLHQFRKANPCPATGKIRGSCPGWEIDHRIALCAGGTDEVNNLQWLKAEQHREKTRKDVQSCRVARPGRQRQ